MSFNYLLINKKLMTIWIMTICVVKCTSQHNNNNNNIHLNMFLWNILINKKKKKTCY